MFARDQLVGVTDHGAAIYVWDETVIVRPLGPRPDGVQPLRMALSVAEHGEASGQDRDRKHVRKSAVRPGRSR
jgi:hypothetical protein